MPAAKPKQSTEKDPRFRLPPMPVATAVHEARLLFDAATVHRARFAVLPEVVAFIDAVPALADALEELEVNWIAAKAKLAVRPVRIVRMEAYRLRRNFVRAARYLLRKKPKELRAVGRIKMTRNAPELHGDLLRVETLATKHGALFASDPLLPADVATTAKSLAAEFVESVQARPDTNARTSRNQAFWQLAEAVAEVRAAARYLFRNEPKILATFVSGYTSRKHRSSRRKRRAASPASSKSSSDA